MRKKIRNIVVAVIICAAVAALGALIYVRSKVTPVSLSKQVAQSLSSMSSVHSVDTIRFSGNTGQQGVNFDVELTAVDDNRVSTNPSAVSSERTVDLTFMGTGTTQKNYIYVDGTSGLMYASTDGQNWYSQRADGTIYSIRTQTMEDFFEAVADEKTEAELDKDDGTETSAAASTGSSEYASSEEPDSSYKSDEVYTLTAGVSGDLLKSMMTGMLTSIEGETSNSYADVDWDGLTAQVTALVAKDSKLPVRIIVDCPELGSRIMRASTGGSGTTSVTCRTFSVQVDLDGYGETKVSIPENIKENASALIGGTDEEASIAATTESGSTEIAPKEEP